jgi:hypothetical protein
MNSEDVMMPEGHRIDMFGCDSKQLPRRISIRRPRSSDGLLDVAANFLLNYGDAVSLRALMSEHAPDGTGHCRAYHSTHLGSPIWPCILYAVGAEALRLAQDDGRFA